VVVVGANNRERRYEIGAGVFDQRLTQIGHGHVSVIWRPTVGLIASCAALPPVVDLSAARRCAAGPHFVGERQGVEFSADLAPGWEVLVEETDEPLAVRWLNQEEQLVNDRVPQLVAGLAVSPAST
jgi:hypothetical protein